MLEVCLGVIFPLCEIPHEQNEKAHTDTRQEMNVFTGGLSSFPSSLICYIVDTQLAL